MASEHGDFKFSMQNTPVWPSTGAEDESFKLQRNAIFGGEWEPYFKSLHAQGLHYANPDLSFHAWFEIVVAFRKFMVPHLLSAYKDAPDRLTLALNGADKLIEITMSVIYESYLEAREKTIKEQKETIKDAVENQIGEEKFRSLLEAAPDAMVIVDEAGKIILINRQTERLFGYQPVEILNQSVDLLLPTWFHLNLQKNRRTHFKVPQVRPMGADLELSGRRKDGTEFPVEISLSPLETDEGVLVTASIRDITERKKAEEATLESAQRYRGLFEDSPISIWEEDLSLVKERIDELRRQGIKDFKTYFDNHPEVVAEYITLIKIVDVNNVSIDLYGAKSRDELLGNLGKILMSEGNGSFQNELINIAEGKTDFNWEEESQTLTGEPIYVHLHWSVIPGYKDSLSRVIVSIIDITENKKAEGALREAEARNRTLIEKLPLIVYVNLSEEISQTTYISPQVETVLGYTVEECLADPTFWQKILHPDDRQKVLERIGQVNLTGEAFDMEYRMLAADGRYVWLRDQAIPVKNPNGKAVYWQGFMIDINEPKQRERELEARAKLSAVLRETQTVNEVLPRLLDESLALLEADSGSIWLLDPDKAELSLRLQRGWKDEGLSKYQLGKNIPDLFTESGEASPVREIRKDTRLPEEYRICIPEGMGGARVPLRSSNAIIGALFVIVHLPREITSGELRILTSLAEIGGNALHRAILFEQTVKQLDRMEALRSIDIAISSSFDLKMTLKIVLDRLTRDLNVDAADILLLKPESFTLEYAAGQGFWTRTIENTSLSIGEGLAGNAAFERKLRYVEDLSGDIKLIKRGHLIEEEKFVSYYAMPLVSKGKVIGVLEIFSRSAVYRDEEWQQFLEDIAGQTAIAIDNSTLFQELQRSNMELALAYDATIEGWSHALDLRDRETEGHTQRVTEMTLKLALAMGITDQELVHMRRGSLLHDIGKMGVPDRILLKTGKLTEDEWVNMRRHPEFAYDMLMPITYLQPALDIPYCHHEKWDGTGYPRGLKGEQIPLAARIFAVVDVWDALRSDRPYRAGWKIEDVLKYIQEQSGKYFDARVVDVFLEQVVNT